VITIALIRHGPTEWTDAKRLQGRTDIPLSAAGREFVETWQLPEQWRSARWTSSPLVRAVETARVLSGRTPDIDRRLIEMDWGEWEGRRLADLRAELGEAMAANEAAGVDFRPPGGESPREVQSRLRDWLTDVVEIGEPMVAVAHHGVVRALFSMATGWNMVGNPPQKFRWGAIQYFSIGPARHIAVERLNVMMTES
jgi:broad specificity phosphatase PhoE